ncbi:MAG: hypothetical protein HOK33_09130 [Rhodobiaceae bacterium]|jgi:hypothetical protein|nr:hypothetical protein [Rhodobiaceae bacterium]MBT5519088.1 hypothetical protein [Rhodobiaceae bacterium]MBT7279549.1 hypothetical protein [Rhodobiaceae bacterium]
MGLAERDESLDSLSIDALRERLHLTPPSDDNLGTLLDDCQALLVLPVGDIIPWQNYSGELQLTFIAGAPAALSWSADGHDAQATHLGSAPHLHQKPELAIAAKTWFAGETLGTWSLLHVASPTPLATLLCEKAADDWFPKPRAPHGLSSGFHKGTKP